MICVSISDSSQIAPVIQSGAELIELRLDLIRTEPDLLYHKFPGNVRTVVTCRPGEYEEDERIRLLSSAIRLGASYVDLELESSDRFSTAVQKAAATTKCEVIISYHDFDATPGLTDLRSIMARCYSRGGDVAKIATQVQERQDLLNLLSLYEIPGRKVVLGMGILGRITRVVSPYMGAEFTFASPGLRHETAPGQLSAAQLEAIYKVIDAS